MTLVLLAMDVTMDVSSVTYLDIIMLLVLFFSAYVLIKQDGLKKGALYLGVLLCVGAVIAVISSHSSTIGKYFVILSILVLGWIWHSKRSKK